MDSNNRTICYYHVTYVFQSEYRRYSWLNAKELLAQNRYDICGTHSHLARIVPATIGCKFSLKRVRNMIITYSEAQLKHSAIIGQFC